MPGSAPWLLVAGECLDSFRLCLLHLVDAVRYQAETLTFAAWRMASLFFVEQQATQPEMAEASMMTPQIIAIMPPATMPWSVVPQNA